MPRTLKIITLEEIGLILDRIPQILFSKIKVLLEVQQLVKTIQGHHIVQEVLD